MEDGSQSWPDIADDIGAALSQFNANNAWYRAQTVDMNRNQRKLYPLLLVEKCIFLRRRFAPMFIELLRPGPCLRLHAAALMAIAAIAPPVMAQGTDADTAVEAGPAGAATVAEQVPGDVVDEIIVVAPKSVMAINAQIRRVDTRMYGLYNEMNTDRQFDIHCRLEKVYASNRKKRICLAAFEHGVVFDTWEDFSPSTGTVNPRAEIRRNREILKQKMMDFAEQNPALKEAIYERANLQRELVEAEVRHRGSDTEE
jgi:hypothetical protein